MDDDSWILRERLGIEWLDELPEVLVEKDHRRRGQR